MFNTTPVSIYNYNTGADNKTRNLNACAVSPE